MNEKFVNTNDFFNLMNVALVSSGSPLSLPKVLLRLEAEKSMKYIFVKKTHLVEKSARVADKIKQLTVSAGERDKPFLKVFCRLPGLNTWGRPKVEKGTNLTWS